MGMFSFFRRSNNVKRAIPVSAGLMNHAQQTRRMIDSLAKGGKIKKTGMYQLHKGEEVLNKKQVKKYHKTKGK